MFINLNVYFRRITDALENVIAPEIESDHVRGQMFAVVELIRQIMDRIEYKPALIAREIEWGLDSIKLVVSAVKDAGGDIPDEIAGFLKDFEDGKAGKGVTLRNKVDEMVCAALDLFHDNLGKIKPEKAAEVDAAIRDNIFKLIGRDLGLLKPPMIEKISRSKR